MFKLEVQESWCEFQSGSEGLRTRGDEDVGPHLRGKRLMSQLMQSGREGGKERESE